MTTACRSLELRTELANCYQSKTRSAKFVSDSKQIKTSCEQEEAHAVVCCVVVKHFH